MTERDPPLPESVEAEELDAERLAEGPTDWSCVDYYRLLSAPLTVRSMSEPFSESLRWHLAPFHHPQAAPVSGALVEVWQRVEDEEEWNTGAWRRAERLVYARDGDVQRMASSRSILEYALWDANALVPRRARDFLFLHAGSVAGGQAGILIPALMDAGKSTLVTALLRTGFEYLSDELGVIDPVTSRAHPFEKLISLDPDALAFFPGLEEQLDDRKGLSAQLHQRYVRPADLDASVSGPVPVRWIVFLEADRDGPPRLERLTRSEAMHRMIGHCFNLALFEDRGLVLLSRVVSGAEAVVLAGGSPRERAELLARRIV